MKQQQMSMKIVLRVFESFFASVGAQLASCGLENSNLKTNRSKFSMVLTYVNETTVGRKISSMTNTNSEMSLV